MAASLLRQALLVRFRLHSYQRLTAGTAAAPKWLWRSSHTGLGFGPSEEEKLSAVSDSDTSDVLKSRVLPTNPWKDDPDYRKWKVVEDEILTDIEPTVMLTKDILHSPRYKDGEQLTIEDEKFVVEKLLSYHPHAEDKIGCGLESIIVDRHPQFRLSRCLFVVRTDGSWIDFSYQKCLREYIRDKYPTHAEKFIGRHYKRVSG